MTKNLLLLCALAPLSVSGQIFQENWDGNGPGIAAWTVIDVDGNTPADDVNFFTSGWIVSDLDGANGDFGGPAGNNAAMSTSWYTPAGTSNDWLISPQVNLTTATAAYLGWDSKAQDNDFPDGYSLMMAPNGGNTVADFTVTLFTVVAENSFWTTHAVDISDYIGSNVRFAFVNNSNDKFVLIVDNILVSADEIVVPITYCPVAYNSVEAISNVTFAGIDNDSDPTDVDNSYEDYTSIVGNVTGGGSYLISVEGNTGGEFDDFISVYIDWNQNGNFNDPNESYEVGMITNSDGTDGTVATATIAVPADVVAGSVRMRVVKFWDAFSPDACPAEGGLFDSTFGQVEDYTLNVTSLGTPSFNQSAFKFYPNPVNNLLNISYNSSIEKTEVYNLVGQKLASQKINASEGQMDISSLATGTYIVKVFAGNTTNVFKIVKQ